MKSALALSAVAAIFLVGTVVGAMGKHVYELHHGPGAHGVHGRDIHDRFVERLHLSDEQRVAIESILRDAHREARELHERLLPEVTAQIDRVHERIRGELDPAQQEIFAELLENYDREMQFMLLAGPTFEPRHDHD